MERHLQQRCVRVLRALSGLADAAADVNVRADCDDAIADLVDVLAGAEQGRADALAAWGRRTERVLSPVREDGVSDERLAYVRLEVLRLRAALDAAAPRPTHPPAAPRPPAVPLSSLTPSQRRVLERVSAGPLRSGALVEALNGQLSPRTVKRSLKELTGLGLIQRRKHDGQVEYRAIS